MNRTRTLTAVSILLAATSPLLAATTRVASLDELRTAITKAQPGDHIILADGSYSAAAPIPVATAGTADKPIVIESQSVGGATIAGEGNFALKSPAAYVVIKGFVFTNHTHPLSVGAGVHHCRLTRNVFALKVGPDERSTFCDVFGDDNEIDYNTFRDKDTEGQMLFVQGPTGSTCAKRTWIHHNYFLDFKNSHKNNASGLHIGSSGRSMDSAFSVVEHNLFVRNVGENEGAVCNKSCDNIYRYNTIVDSRELSLRHGHRVQVYGNFLLNSDGLRFFAHDHQIYSNYFEHCQTAVAIGNGDGLIPPAALTAHQRPERVQVVYNTLVDNKANFQMGGRSKGLGAIDITLADNLIVGGPKALSISGPFDNAKTEGNILWHTDPGDMPKSGFTTANPDLSKPDNSKISRPAPNSPVLGKGTGDFDFVKVDIDGQPRGPKPDIGADQLSDAPILNRPLTAADVGPTAPDDADRPLLSAPQSVHWIPATPAR